MGDYRGLRTLLACTATIAVTAALATPAGATANDRPSADARRTPSSLQMDGRAAVPTGSVTPGAQGRNGSRLAAAAQLPAPACPVGMSWGRTVNQEGFEDGVSDPSNTTGWGVNGNAPVQGSQVASSVHAAGTAEDDAVLYLEPMYGTPGARTFLSFATRGDDVFDNVGFGANDTFYGMDLSPSWERVQVEITEAVGYYDDHFLDAGFIHLESPSDTWWEVDDVTVFTCVTPKASGVRGDWTGEGSVDVLATTPDGTLRLYPGKTNGGVYAGRNIGTGWSDMTYLGSPGDINGDRRTDLVARSADGTLYMYAGRGEGAFAKAVQIGRKWNSMTALITSGDVDGDGRPDLMARRSDGTLHLYRFSSSGILSYRGQVGSGWNGMQWMVGMGDLSGDGRGDVLGITRTGAMYAYRGTANGLLGTGLVGRGWGGMTWVTSPGDMSLDGRGDLLARNGDGDLIFYPGKLDGVRNGTVVGGGWDGLVRIL